jgi:hypothetical protein
MFYLLKNKQVKKSPAKPGMTLIYFCTAPGAG